MTYLPDTVQSLSTSLEIKPAIKALLEGLANVSGMPYMQAVSKSICEALGADIALIGQVSDDRRKMQTIAMYRFGEHVEDITYSLKGTPCAKTISQDYCMHASGVQQEYPDDQDLVDDAIEGYVGYPLMDEDGLVIGAIIALSQSAFDLDTDILDFARIAAARTRAELQHHKLREKLKNTLSESLVLNYTKSMFMANISNEMREPLNSIAGYAELIHEGQIPTNDVKEYANSIYLITEELQSFINDIISLSSLDLWHNELAHSKFDLTGILLACKNTHLQQAVAKNIDILPLERTTPLYVTGDPIITKKAILNILQNAIKFTLKGHIKIAIAETEEGAEITIEDTGVGMSQEKISRVCKSIQEISKTYGTHKNGRGLGVPLSVMMLEKQGASLVLESEEGIGTTARITFPKKLIVNDEDDFI